MKAKGSAPVLSRSFSKRSTTFALPLYEVSSSLGVTSRFVPSIQKRCYAEGTEGGSTSIHDLLKQLKKEREGKQQQHPAPEAAGGQTEGKKEGLDTLFNNIYKGEHQKKEDETRRRPAKSSAATNTQESSPTTQELGPPKLRLEDLKYFYLYNKKMRQWIIDSKTPRGFFSTEGRWEPRYIFPTWDEMVVGTDKDDRPSRRIEFEREKRTPLPREFQGVYRFGVTEEELEEVGADETIRDLLSFRHAFRKELNQERIRQAVEKWGRHIGDTGSSEVQIAVLTIKIRTMTDYLKRNHKNHAFKRHLQMMIDRRRVLMQYLKKQNAETYYKLLMDLGLRDMVAIRVNRKAYK